jgi:hypothetical protein
MAMFKKKEKRFTIENYPTIYLIGLLWTKGIYFSSSIYFVPDKRNALIKTAACNLQFINKHRVLYDMFHIIPVISFRSRYQPESR